MAKVMLLFLVSLPANTPIVDWRLEPSFEEVNLCLKPCVLKAYHVTDYRWVYE